MRYHLSNGQRKELLLRGTPLAIAIPAPPEDPPNWLEWARNVIVEDGQHVVSAEPCTVTVSRSGIEGDGLTGFIGTIHEGTPDFFCWGVDAVVCHLDPPGSSRRDRKRVQWPATAVRGDQRWPEPK